MNWNENYMEYYARKGNVIICRLNVIDVVKEISKDAKVVGEVNCEYIENDCIIMNEHENFDGMNVTRIEYKERVKGKKIGYVEIGYNEYLVLRSIERMRIQKYLLIMFLLFILDLILVVLHYS